MTAAQKPPFRLPKAIGIGSKPYEVDPVTLNIMNGRTSSAHKLIALINYLEKQELRIGQSAPAGTQLALFAENTTAIDVLHAERKILTRCAVKTHPDSGHPHNPYRDTVDGIRYLLGLSKSPFWEEKLNGKRLAYPDMQQPIKTGNFGGETVHQRVEQAKIQTPWLGLVLGDWVTRAEKKRETALKAYRLKASEQDLTYNKINSHLESNPTRGVPQYHISASKGMITNPHDKFTVPSATGKRLPPKTKILKRRSL